MLLVLKEPAGSDTREPKQLNIEKKLSPAVVPVASVVNEFIGGIWVTSPRIVPLLGGEFE